MGHSEMQQQGENMFRNLGNFKKLAILLSVKKAVLSY